MEMLPGPENTALGSFIRGQVLAEASMARAPEMLSALPWSRVLFSAEMLLLTDSPQPLVPS